MYAFCAFNTAAKERYVFHVIGTLIPWLISNAAINSLPKLAEEEEGRNAAKEYWKWFMRKAMREPIKAPSITASIFFVYVLHHGRLNSVVKRLFISKEMRVQRIRVLAIN